MAWIILTCFLAGCVSCFYLGHIRGYDKARSFYRRTPKVISDTYVGFSKCRECGYYGPDLLTPLLYKSTCSDCGTIHEVTTE